MRRKIIVLILEILSIIAIIVTAEIAFSNYVQTVLNSSLIT